MTQKVLMEVGPTGKTTVSAEGFTGGTCMDATAPFEALFTKQVGERVMVGDCASLPDRRGAVRHFGAGPGGQRVNNVTEANRYDVDPKNPWVQIILVGEGRGHVLATCWIKRTREFPDVVMYKGMPYLVVQTNVPAGEKPIYAACMVSAAYDKPEEPKP